MGSRQEKWLCGLEANGRRVLRDGVSNVPGWTVLRLAKPAVGYLLSVSLPNETLALPLRSGLTVVGSGQVAQYTANPRRLRGVIEGAQWRVQWSPARVTVQDDASTSGSVVVPKRYRAEVPLSLSDAQKDPRCRRVGWDGVTRHHGPVILEPGDVLVNAYGAFVYLPVDPEFRPIS